MSSSLGENLWTVAGSSVFTPRHGHDGSWIGHPDWGMSVWMPSAGSTLASIRNKAPHVCGRPSVCRCGRECWGGRPPLSLLTGESEAQVRPSHTGCPSWWAAPGPAWTLPVMLPWASPVSWSSPLPKPLITWPCPCLLLCPYYNQWCDYTPNWIIQGNLSTLRFLITSANSLLLQGNIHRLWGLGREHTWGWKSAWDRTLQQELESLSGRQNAIMRRCL